MIMIEVILGFSLYVNTPKEVIETIQYLLNNELEVPNNFPEIESKFDYFFKGSSYYFGVCKPVKEFWKDKSSGQWCLSSRTQTGLKQKDIEELLNWLKPYIEYGSGLNDVYAMTIGEEDINFTVYSLYED